MLSMTVKSKEVTFAMISVTSRVQLKTRDLEGLCDNPYLRFPRFPQKSQPKQEAMEENSFKSVIRKLSVQLPATESLWRGAWEGSWEGEGLAWFC